MTHGIEITRAGPLVSIQDHGRPGLLAHGISASGPMDRQGYCAAGRACGSADAAIEFGVLGFDFTYHGAAETIVGFAGGKFLLAINGKRVAWPGSATLEDGDRVTISMGAQGNYGYVRFDRSIEVRTLMGSKATNITAGLGGFEGRPLAKGDFISFSQDRVSKARGEGATEPSQTDCDSIRFIWGIHAHVFAPGTQATFCEADFTISSQIDRMGIRLIDKTRVFAGQQVLSLVSDAVVPGDIQILGDGTPVVLMRDHQPTGGYPRIGTVIDADMDRLAQQRPGATIKFQPIRVEVAQRLVRVGGV